MTILDRARPEIRAFTPYRSARSSAGRAPVMLNANELPWSATDYPDINRYPDPQPAELLACLSDYYEVPTDQILVSRGSDEAIDLLVRAFCEASRVAILQCPPCFGMYAIAARIQGARVLEVPLLAPDFALDLTGIIESLEPDLKLVFLTSPNNPTGNLMDTDQVLTLARELAGQALVVVDEAYIEFTDQPSLAPLTGELENLVVLRTLSKAFGLAGSRCGVAIADAGVIGLLRRILPPYPLPGPTVDLAMAALAADKREQVRALLDHARTNKDKLLKLIREQAWVARIWPGAANFVLLETAWASQVHEQLSGQGIEVRDFSSHPLLPGCLRISVGSDRELTLLDRALAALQIDGLKETRS